VANVQEDAIDFENLAVMGLSEVERRDFRIEKGDIVVNVSQSPKLVGRPALVRSEVSLTSFQNHLARFRPGPTLDPEFAVVVFRHYLHSGVFRAASKWSTNLATLGLARLAAIPIPLPPLEEQRLIAAECRKLLLSCEEQERFVRASLSRLPFMEAELLSAAVGGELVPQDPIAEPATDLLARLGEVPSEEFSTVPSNISENGDEISAPSQRGRGRKSEPETDLAGVLREAGRPLSVPELFRIARYDRDSVADVEKFYLALRQQYGRTIRAVDGEADNTENTLLEDARYAT
jgi:type I restriction enzyme S subunit